MALIRPFGFGRSPSLIRPFGFGRSLTLGRPFGLGRSLTLSRPFGFGRSLTLSRPFGFGLGIGSSDSVSAIGFPHQLPPEFFCRDVLGRRIHQFRPMFERPERVWLSCLRNHWVSL